MMEQVAELRVQKATTLQTTVEKQAKEIAHLTNLVKELIADKDKRDLAEMEIHRE
jgi:hypothetical protein